MNYRRRTKFTTTLSPMVRERLQQIADAFHRDCNEILEDMVDEFYRKSFKKRLENYQRKQKEKLRLIQESET